MSELRRLPSLLVISSALSLSVAVAGSTADVSLYTGLFAAFLWCVSFFTAKKGWAFRVAAGWVASAALAFSVYARPRWDALLASLIPLSASTLYFGPPFAPDSGPGWTRNGPVAGNPGRLACSIDGYVLIILAMLFQFLGETSGLLVISIILSAAGLVALVSTAVGGPSTINDARKLSRITSVFSMVYIAGYSARLPAIRLALAIVAGIFAAPATI